MLMLPVPAAGRLAGVDGVDRVLDLDRVEEVAITIAVGTEVEPLPEGNRYLGFVFARGGEPEEVVGALREAGHQLQVRIDPARGGAPTA